MSSKPAFLTNFYYYARILEVQPATGACRELTRDQLPSPDADKGPGVYIEKKGTFYGVRPSAQGPVFIKDAEQIPLRIGVHTAQFQCKGQERLFELYQGDNALVSVSYTSDILEEFDAYSGGSKDFFDWLSQKILEDFFHSLYTIPD